MAIDDQLYARGPVMVPAGLCSRIIFAAAHRIQHAPLSLREKVLTIFGDVGIPAPVYIIPCTVVFGVILGFSQPLKINNALEYNNAFEIYDTRL